MSGRLSGPNAAILARYSGGECLACERPIIRGELIVKSRTGGWLHADCHRATLPATDDVPAVPDKDEEARAQ
jgi:hypothetical protein